MPSTNPPAPGLASDADLRALVRAVAREKGPWLWPVAAIGCLALAGYRFGTAGAFIVAAQIVATLAFVATLRLGSGRPVAAALAATVAGSAVVVVLLWQADPAAHWPGRAEPATVAGPADLRGARPSSGRLGELDLRGAVLIGADLDEVVLVGRDLSGARMTGATLRRANLTNAVLRGADLRGADLTGACLRGTDLGGVLMAGARVTEADFGDFDLGGDVLRTLDGVPLAAGRAPSCGR